MKSIEKAKNILDLRHQRLLNYLNISIILTVSSFITIVIGTKEFWTLNHLLPLALIIIVAIAFIILFFETKITQIKKEILSLK